MTYNNKGKLKLTVVSGASYTGLYAPDGSYNTVQTSENTTIKGVYHPCGALWTTVSANNTSHNKDGSKNSVSDGAGGFVLSFP